VYPVNQKYRAIWGTIVLFTVLAIPGSPTPGNSQVPHLDAPVDTSPAETSDPGFEDSATVNLTLPALLNLVVQGNRDLREAQLQRLIEQQELEEVESIFEPQFTPEAQLELQQDLEDNGLEGVEQRDSAEVSELGNRTILRRHIGVRGELLTPLGTQLEARVNPLSDDLPVTMTITQPLLRGFGRTVNEASVNVARLTETRNQLALRQTLINTVTEAITQYNALIQSQEAVRIQQEALARRQQELEMTQALVAAGRRAQIDLLSNERSVAEAERQLVEARNSLEQANTALLNQIGTDETLRFVASTEAIAQLYGAALERVATYEQDRLIALAYQQRPDYLQAQLAIEIAHLNWLVAQDNQRWQLDLRSETDLGERSQTALSLNLSRTFGDGSLDTAEVRQEVAIQQGENRLAQLTETIRNDIANQLNTVNANRVQVETAQREVEAARLQLEADRERFRRGRGNVSLTDVITSEERLVTAQNAQLVAQIAFLNSIAELEQIVGITLETWSEVVDFAPVLHVEY
jgi:outer membrane protein TolC